MPNYHQVPTSSVLFSSLSAGVTNVSQPDDRSPRQAHDQGASTFQVSVPGGPFIVMKDPAGSSMSLNLDIEPSSGSPILSGPAANIQGDVPNVHSCNCNKSIASPHKLSPPRTAERSLGEAHAIRPSLKSLHGRQLRPTPILTHARTSLEQTRLSQSPCLNTGESRQKQRSKAPAPVTYADILQSPFTPTPASVQRRSQSPNISSAFFTPETCLDETITPPAPSTPNRNAPPRLDTLPTQSSFDSDFDAPLVQSPSPIDRLSDVSRQSAVDPLRSLPNSPSYSVSGYNSRTVIPRPRLVIDVQPDRPMESAVDRPPSSRATDYQGATVERTLPGRPESATHSVNDDSSTQDGVRTTGVTSHFSDHHLVDASAHNTNSTSDLPTDRAAGPSMIEPDDRELRHSLTTDSEAMPTEPVSSCGTSLSGEVKGTWVGNLKRDHMTLKLDISLDGLKFGLHNLSLSVSSESLSSLDLGASLNDRPRPVTELHWTHATSAAEISMNRINQFEETQERQGNWDARTDSSQSITTDRSRPSTASVLSELPLTPIPELLHTPTRLSIPYASPLPTARLHPPAQSVEHRHLPSNIPGPLDSEPVLVQIKEGEREVGIIRNALRNLANEWQNLVMMPDGVSLHDVEDRCTALDDALFDLSPIILLTWPPMRQASLGTDGGQPPAREQQWHLEHMGETERKWYLKQHEFTTSLQRNLTRLTLLARRVFENPDTAYRGNAMERISQFTIKFEDIALRLKLAYHVRREQKYRSRVQHGARRTDPSREQAAALEYHKARLTKVREEIEGIKHAIRHLGEPVQFSPM